MPASEDAATNATVDADATDSKKEDTDKIPEEDKATVGTDVTENKRDAAKAHKEMFGQTAKYSCSTGSTAAANRKIWEPGNLPKD